MRFEYPFFGSLATFVLLILSVPSMCTVVFRKPREHTEGGHMLLESTTVNLTVVYL